MSNREQVNRLIYAGFATPGNAKKQVSADCGSEGRGFEPRRSPRRQARGDGRSDRQSL